jgi:tRNA(Ile)-lysidine synthase
LLEHARSRGLVWREDATNQERTFTRNRLRHDALPALANACGRDPVPAMERFARVAREEDALLDALARDALNEITRETHALDLAGLIALPPALARRVLQRWLVSLTGASPNFREIEHGLAIARAKGPPSRTNLTGGHHLARRQKRLHFEKSD